MPPLACANCRQLLQAEARACPSCGHGAGFDPLANAFLHLDADSGQWRTATGEAKPLKPCDNTRYGVCNWLVEADSALNLCRSCRHNRTIPDLSVPGVLQRWAQAENAKHRVIASLIRLGLPLETRNEHPQGLAFDLLYDPSAEQGYAPQLLTGHAGGIVTLNLIETDDAARERIRRDMGEPYRTLIGHFRHEVAHHFWHRLVEFSPDLEPFRQRFGDERADYAAALAAHYQNRQHPPLADWEEAYVSAYATVHPWEDFAETFAHYLHIVDTLATIGQFGTRIDAPPGAAMPEPPVVNFDPYTADTPTLARCWIPFAFALNAINRSMGQPDLYPFRLTPAIMLKLDFVNRLIAFTAGRWAPSENEGADLKAVMAVLGLGVDLAS
ncbi:hypothetical protein FHS96_002667 [Sphingomonas zeicaulis]|uniref:zinc-binding metallopeptidase family protein n=1 Tax=Sphingomonas zeicaulis TaxID=1632740 RepID=UPI003D211433